MPHKSIKILCEDQCNDTISAGFESGDSSPREEIRYEGVISVSEIRLGTTIKGIAEPSSAKLDAPVQASSPEASHTARLAPTLFVFAMTTPGEELCRIYCPLETSRLDLRNLLTKYRNQSDVSDVQSRDSKSRKDTYLQPDAKCNTFCNNERGPVCSNIIEHAHH